MPYGSDNAANPRLPLDLLRRHPQLHSGQLIRWREAGEARSTVARTQGESGGGRTQEASGEGVPYYNRVNTQLFNICNPTLVEPARTCLVNSILTRREKG
jgi:hypothetical protein